jgi:PAS domain S-box-containing protein
VASKPGSNKKSGNTRRRVDAGGKDRLISELKDRVAALENELRSKQENDSSDGVAERKLAEEALAAAYRQFQGITDNTPDIVYAFDLEERFILANAACAKLLNSTPEQMIGKRRHEFMPKEDADWHEANDRQVIEAGRALEFEEHSHLEGRSITWLTKKFPLRDARGRIYAVAGISADISERKRAEEALRKSEEQYRGLFESSRDAIGITDMSGNILKANTAFQQMLGYSAEEMRRISYQELTPKRWRKRDEQIVREQVIPRGFSDEYEKEYIRKDGTIFPITIRVWLIKDKNGANQGLWAIIRDITERKLAEAALQEKQEELELQAEELEASSEELRQNYEELHRVNQSLAESESRLQTVLMSMTEGLIISDPWGKIVSFNDAAVKIHRYRDVSEWRRYLNDFTDTFELYDLDGCLLPVEKWPLSRALKGEIFTGMEVKVKRIDTGYTGVWSYRGTPIRDASGNVTMAVLTVEDISERKRAEANILQLNQELARRVSELQMLLDLVPVSVSIALDKECSQMSANRTFMDLVSMKPGSNISQNAPEDETPNFRAFLHGKELPREELPMQKAAWTGKSVRGAEFDAVFADGHVINFYGHAEPLFDEQGNVRGAIGAFDDVTERKRVEEALKLTQASVDGAAELVAWFLPDGKVYYVNDATCRALGYSREELMMMTALDFSPDITWEQYEQHWKEVRERKSFTLETTHRRKDGSLYPAEVLVNYVQYGGQEFLFAYGRDITERKRAEDALRDSEERFRALADNIPNLAWMADADGWFVWYNKQWYDYTGTTLEEMQGWGWQKVHHPDYIEAVMAGWSSCLREGKTYEDVFPLRGKDGNYRWFLTRNTPIRNSQGNIQRWLGTNTDITERKQAEEERERLLKNVDGQRRHLQAMMDSIPAAVFIADPEGKILQINDYAGKIWGGSAIVPSPGNWHEYSEWVGYWADTGKRLTAEEWTMTRVLTKGETITGDVIDIERFDGIRGTILGCGAPVKDADGNIIGGIVIDVDITDRRKMEKDLNDAKMQAELYLDLMGHDISNMHQIILGQLQLAEDIMGEEGKLDAADRELIDVSIKNLLRSARLIDNVKNLQRLRAGDYSKEPTDLGMILDDAVATYSGIPEKNVTIDYRPVKGYIAMVNPLIKEVIYNLLDNAVKHSGDPVTIGITVDRAERNGVQYHRVSIEDNGPGISDEKKEEVFHRLKRGQTKARGTGLGLYLVKMLVESFGGLVELEDRVRGDYMQGCRFLVYLPAVEGDENGE